VWTDEHITTMVLRVTAAVVFVAGMVLHRAALTILQRLEDRYTVLWFDLGLSTAESQRTVWGRGGTGGWRLLRFVWSRDIDKIDDPTIHRCGLAMRVATVAVAAALGVILYTGATHGWQRRSLVQEEGAPGGQILASRSLDAGQPTISMDKTSPHPWRAG
jgi:hypothetical protein